MEEQHDDDDLLDDEIVKQEKKDFEEECAICLSSIEEKTDLSITKCGHRFHCSCLIKAALKKRQCPMCRKNLIDNEEEDIISDNRVYIFNGQFPLIIQQLREIFENNPLVATPLEDQQDQQEEQEQQEQQEQNQDDDDDDFYDLDDDEDDQYSDDNSIFNDLPNLLPFDIDDDDDDNDNNQQNIL
jgi:hypothetical protein